MVVKFITKSGQRVHEPPYTEAEEAEFYRRVGNGPVAWRWLLLSSVARLLQSKRQNRQRNNTRLPSLLQAVDPAWTFTDDAARVLDVLARRSHLCIPRS
jgi:hypothetical protein